ncbi:MAG: branched-chain amino acid ABC transporter permease [Deltaproteobacteria bacterium RBG_16_49_23]|nr:MAG: branched-chain amino acid ABC transporter permease [Deltaproteobacteria bacterium RBG_16_49_23]
METIVSIIFSGVFNASTLFLVAAGLQVVFGVQKVFNLACGSFYALGAYFGIVVVKSFVAGGFPKPLFIVPLIGAGLLLGFIGPIVERGLIKFVYDRDETFQLLLTFALVMMIEDVIKFIWGTSPQTTGGIDLIYGRINLFGATLPVYNLIVILCSLIIAALIGYILLNTKFGRIIRATADKKEMGEALGINMKMVYIKVFTLGTVLGTLGGALVIPATAVVSEMGVELIVLAFAVVVIGGLGSMKGAFIGALIVGVLKSVAISTYPELEMLTIYIIVIAVLVIKPQGLFGGSKV